MHLNDVVWIEYTPRSTICELDCELLTTVKVTEVSRSGGHFSANCCDPTQVIRLGLRVRDEYGTVHSGKTLQLFGFDSLRPDF
ncbi:hypothetical protein MSS4_04081 [Mycobacterium marinum]|nr:hypothetical protein MSS4_04081 [Mycobacterium marinum]